MPLDVEARVRMFLDSLYDGVVEADGFTDLSSNLVNILSASSSCLNVRQNNAIVTLATANILSAEVEYLEYYQHIDPWLQGTSRTPMIKARFGEEIISSKSLSRSEFYCDFAGRYEIFHMLTAYMPLADGNDFALGLHRPASAEPFSDQERQLLDRLLPHLARALRLRGRVQSLSRRHDAGLAALDALIFPAIICNADGKVVCANGAAERVATEGHWFSLGTHATRVRAHNAAYDARLQALIRNAANGGSGGALNLHARCSGEVLNVLVTALPRRFADIGDPLALVTMTRSGHRAIPSPQFLVQLLGLTAAEAQLVLGLIRGLSLDEIAAERSVRYDTVRSQLKNVFIKLDVQSQREVVGCVLSIPQIKQIMSQPS